MRDLWESIKSYPRSIGRLWTQYHTHPAAKIKQAVGASLELRGSGGRVQFFAGNIESSGLA
jgi:hypothetical protein